MWPPRSSTSNRRRALVIAAWSACAPGCHEPEPDDEVTPIEPFEVEPTCVPPAGVSNAPQSIDEVVALVGALPMPVTLPCLLEVLARPLHVVASTSPFSAQPTEATDNPRLFLLGPQLVMTVLPEGDGAEVLELAQYVEPGQSIKAEIEFPVAEPLAPADPYDHVLLGGVASCGLCHDGQRQGEAVDGVPTYVSKALAPNPQRRISLAFVEQHARDCDPQADAVRCGVLRAVFGHGEVGAGSFVDGTEVCADP